ncbi:MAG: thrombospondin type 3 repeat-containing protein [Polyangiaceae bacterium]
MRRTNLRRLATAACAMVITGVAATAAAQDAPATPTPPLALDRFYPAPPGDRMFGVQSPYVAGDLTPHFSVVADYAHNPLVLRTVNSGEDRGAIVSDQLFLHIQGGLAFKQRLFVNMSFPIALLQSGSSPSGNGINFNSPQDADIGDLRLGLRVRLFGDYWDPFQLALGGYLWIPTGNGTDGTFVGDGNFRGLPQVIVGGRIAERVVWSFNVGPDLRSSQVFGANGGAAGVSQSTMVRVDGGLGFLVDDARNLQVGLEANAAFNVDNQTGDPVQRSTNVELLAGGRYRFLHDFEVGVGAGPGLTSGLGTPDVRVVGMLSYTPEMKKEAPPVDTDGDGIFDPMDACPTVKGMPNANPKLNGCADSDGDTILDPIDSCPTVKGLASEDPKLHGCPDTDGDGIFDAVDACPADKGLPFADPEDERLPGQRRRRHHRPRSTPARP